MVFPGVGRLSLHVPHAFVPFGLAVCAILLTLFGWVLLAPANVGTDVVIDGPDITSIRSIAYTIPGEQFDEIVVRPASGATSPRVIASFPSGGPTGFHARGSASPLGDRIAVLWLPPFVTTSNLSILDVASGQVRDVERSFDSLSALAWSPDGSRITATATTELDGVKRTEVVEVDIVSMQARPVAEFESAIEVVPVGYSFDSSRLFIVVVDARGTNLLVERGGKTQPVAELSPGRTRDWALSPDGSRLAYVDVLSGGSRTYVGRSLMIATGAITTLPAGKNQLGASWMPGSPIPAFGGPGGEWQLTDPASASAYIVPEDWSPDGAFLVATVHAAGNEKSTRPTTALELISRQTSTTQSSRLCISEAVGAAFLGWVHDLT